jgi:outer membrane scaffolding protein for murein synthesis (MipA/OmpV family)
MSWRLKARQYLVAALWLTATSAYAGQELARIPIDTAPPGTPAIGGGIRSGADIYIGSDRDPDLVPLYLYEGKWLFAHGTSGGLHAFKNANFSFDLILRYRFDKLDPNANELLAGLNERHQTLEGGVSGSWFGRFGALKAEYVWDAQNNHNGNQFDLAYRYPFQWGNFSFSPFAALLWQDADLVDYYYGVSAEESAATGIPTYQAGAATNFAYGINSSYHLTDHIFLFANLGFQAFDTAIRNSPITEDEFAAGLFVGGGYLFGDMDGQRKGSVAQETTWSWRVNYGYTGKHNIVPDPMQGKLAQHEEVHTDIGGLTVGRLVQSGERVDIYAKLALYRHFEKGLQDDFWNYTAYIMAIGKGYLPWSDRLAFRWGFGFGFSAAEKVPYIEQVKQGNRDRNTSHFLNYLEWTVDFPLEGLIKSKLTRNCFAGVTVVHRSGIFETSDILGEVAGGADWYTIHLECLR